MVAVLFARADSNYKALPGVDVWDIERDARRWPGGDFIVAHPPCRAWGRLRAFANPRPDEKQLAIFAVEQIRRWGGVLEHPKASPLWPAMDLPKPGAPADAHGGWSIEVEQFHWGHRAAKATWLYIVGCPISRMPDAPFRQGEPTHVVQSRKRTGYKPHITKAERESTPLRTSPAGWWTSPRGAIWT